MSVLLCGCGKFCSGPKIEMTVGLDQTVFLKQLAGENLNPGFIRTIDSIANSVDPHNKSLLLDLIDYYEERAGGKDTGELFSCFPGQKNGDFTALKEFFVSKYRDSFRTASDILKSRFLEYENMCVVYEVKEERIHIQFTDSLRQVSETLISIPGYFQILETVTLSELEEVFQLADTVLSVSDTSIGGKLVLISFRELFNPEVLPNPQSPIIGRTTPEDSGMIASVIRNPKMQTILDNENIDLIWTKSDGQNVDTSLQLIAVKRNTKSPSIGVRVREAFVGGIEGKPAVRISLDAAGAIELRTLTERNLGRNLAVVLDGVVWQLAKISESIIDGKFELTGGLSEKQSKILAAVLNSGPLPLPFQFQSVNQGLKSTR